MMTPSGVVRLDLEHVGHRVGVDAERVVARRGERARNPGEQVLPVVGDLVGLAVHRSRRAADARAVHLGDALVAEAHAEQRHPRLGGQRG